MIANPLAVVSVLALTMNSDPTFAGKLAREYETVNAKHAARAASFALDLA
jgi:hypothetical protein